ncbi:hypothetical protein EBN03_02300 [Nocardia stercoris]|uniref:Uncharacterized protein n=2 Tax=Nocardia stercoris TaxID=2483361 RepID=A0A3M2LCA6_9NOCA|nr:hypothetical protein EBN03_02300 [Nocardia stercoris]
MIVMRLNRLDAGYTWSNRTSTLTVSAAPRGYRGLMGMIGEMFPSKKLQHEGSGDSDGQEHEPRVELDLDAGVIRLSGSRPDPASNTP